VKYECNNPIIHWDTMVGTGRQGVPLCMLVQAQGPMPSEHRHKMKLFKSVRADPGSLLSLLLLYTFCYQYNSKTNLEWAAH
jgi:hypothetical protein